MTREELRSDILEIVTAAVVESSRSLRRTLSKDIVAVSNRVDRLEKRMTKGFKAIDKRFEQVDVRFEQIDARFEQIQQDVHRTNVQMEQTNHLIKAHITDPQAHNRLTPA